MSLTRRSFAGAAATAALQPLSSQQERWNVIFMLTDDHGEWALGPWGCSEIHTPNIARLAKEGIRFTQAFASTPVCSPSRMTYMTGKLPSQHGVHDFLMQEDTRATRQFLVGHNPMSQVLASNGYATGVSGKWHMGDDVHPQAGFQFWRCSPGGGGRYKDPDFSIDGKPIVVPGYKTALTADYALEFIEANRSRPFFLYVPFNAPHTPFDYQPEADRAHYNGSSFSCFPEGPRHPQRRDSFEKMHANRETKTSYSALVTGVDVAVGRILRKLEDLKIREKTIVILSADQGWNAGHHGFWGKGNGTIPFNLYEESIRVPLIWSQPGHIPADRLMDPLVSSYDLYPTLLDYLGVKTEPDRQRPGTSYAPFLRGQSPAWRSELFFEYCNTRGVRSRTWKYIERGDNWPSELYDMASDPRETVNRIGDKTGKDALATLRPKLRSFFDSLGSPPIDEWRKTARAAIPLDAKYYDDWWKRTAPARP